MSFLLMLLILPAWLLQALKDEVKSLHSSPHLTSDSLHPKGLFRKERLLLCYLVIISQCPLRDEPTRFIIPFPFNDVIIRSSVLLGISILLASSFNEILLSSPINAKIFLSTSLLTPLLSPFGVDWR